MNRPDIIADRLRMARHANGYTQYGLAICAKCAESMISNIECERQRLSVPMAVKFGKILNVRPAWLLDLEE